MPKFKVVRISRAGSDHPQVISETVMEAPRKLDVLLALLDLEDDGVRLITRALEEHLDDRDFDQYQETLIDEVES